MDRFSENGLPGKALLILILISLLGISPRPHTAERELEKAYRYLSRGASLSASASLARAADYYPWRTDLWELAGRSALKGGDPRAAINYLGQAAARGGLSSAGCIDLGDAYQAAGDLPNAIRIWQSAPPSPEVYTRLVKAHRSLQDYTAAIADLKALLMLQPNDAQSCYQLGLLLAATRPESALAYLIQAAELDPSLAGTSQAIQRQINTARLSDEPSYALMAAGRALASLNEWEMAVEAFRQATLARTDYAEAWAYLGEARQHFKTGSTSTDDGLSDLQKALSIDPASLSTNLFLAMYWQRQERYDQALTYLGVATKLDPDNSTLETELGKTLAAAGDLPAAQGHYLRAVELAPKDATYWRILAEFSLQYQIQIRQIALPASRQAVILTPDDPRALDLMGQALFMLDDTLNAERFLLRALQTDPGYAPAHLHLGQVYLLEGEAGRARQQLDTALALSPDTPTADQAQRLLQRYFP